VKQFWTILLFVEKIYAKIEIRFGPGRRRGKGAGPHWGAEGSGGGEDIYRHYCRHQLRGPIGALNELDLRKADLVIRPDVDSIHWVNFRKLGYCIRKGEESTRARLADIRKLMRKRRLETMWKRFWEPQ